MTDVINQSMYPMEVVERLFWHARRYHCISIKASFGFAPDGRLLPLRTPSAIEHDEVWSGQPMRSSLVHPGDLIPFKPRTDILVVGTAVPPKGRPQPHWDARLAFPGGEKRLRLFGPRAWRHSLLSGWSLSAPEPTQAVSLQYENAYGGVVDAAKQQFEEGEFYPENPFGCGYLGRARPRTEQDYRAPQIEAWNGAISRLGKDVPVGGFGPVPGFVPSRAKYMGTWERDGQPTVSAGVPSDMDMRYWNTAPEDQQIEGELEPGAVIRLDGMTERGQLALTLPHIKALSIAQMRTGRRLPEDLSLDTVLIDLDRKQLQLRYHGIREADAEIESIRVVCAPTKPIGEVHTHG